jgi:hypothetical protein
MEKSKIPKKGAVARLRELFYERRNQPLSSEEKKRLRETFKKKSPEAVPEKPKKSARQKSDLELP